MRCEDCQRPTAGEEAAASGLCQRCLYGNELAAAAEVVWGIAGFGIQNSSRWQRLRLALDRYQSQQ